MKHCMHCKKKLEKDQVKFCSKSCAAKINNLLHPKRYKTKKCKFCKSLIVSGRTYCPKCIKLGKHVLGGIKIEDRKLKDMFYLSGSSKYAKIRWNARKVLKKFNIPKKCKICKYNKHVEASHIKPVSKFNENTLIKVINDISNLVWLCPNHHWELDNGLLKL